MKNQQPFTARPREYTSSHHDEKSNLELTLGMPSANSYGPGPVAAPVEKKVCLSAGPLLHHHAGGGSETNSSCSFSDGGFVHLWSLAAPQEKAALKQKHLGKTLPRSPYPSHIMSGGRQPMTVVGWPPVRATWKNLSGPRPTETSVGAAQVGKETKKPRTTNSSSAPKAAVAVKSSDATMFVKVNLEGLAVGRTIDLMAHDGYQSLFRAVRTMFRCFLPAVKRWKEGGRDGRGEVEDADLVLLYEDNEGDKMLVGDVPWKMFVVSVRRLYITYRAKTYLPVNGDRGN